MTEPHGYQRFLAELKRRKVFRLAALYGGAGFVAVQAADVFVPALGLPPWILRAIAFLVIAGFPLALLVAWIFERTQPSSPRIRGRRGNTTTSSMAHQTASEGPPASSSTAEQCTLNTLSQ